MAGATNRDTFVDGSNGANLNQAADTVLHTFTARNSCIIRRFGVAADSANGLLAASVLKLQTVPLATGVAADVTGAVLNSAVVARGSGIVKSLDSRLAVAAGDSVVIAVSVDAGAASTGDVWLEYSQEPWNTEEASNFVESS